MENILSAKAKMIPIETPEISKEISQETPFKPQEILPYILIASITLLAFFVTLYSLYVVATISVNL